MIQPLAIVGASTRAAAASALRAGFQPLAADLFADADLRQFATATRISPYPDGLLDWVRTIEPPAWMYTGALENHPSLVDQMAWIAPLWGNPGDVLSRVRSPWQLGKTLRAAGLLFPETRSTADGLSRDGSWLAKTYHGASGSGVRELIETRRQGDKETRGQTRAVSAEHAPCLPLSLSPSLVFQQRVAGMPCAAIFVAAGGKATLLGVTRQLVGEGWLGAHGFQYAGSIGPMPLLPDSVLATILQIGGTIAREFELIGLFGVDMIVDDEQVWTIEVNPRYTASVEIVERATGVHAIAAHAAACAKSLGTEGLGVRVNVLALGSGFHGKAILFARRDVAITREFAESTLAEALHSPWPKLADISPAGSRIEAGRPVLTIFADGTSPDEVGQVLRERVALLERQLYLD